MRNAYADRFGEGRSALPKGLREAGSWPHRSEDRWESFLSAQPPIPSSARWERAAHSSHHLILLQGRGEQKWWTLRQRGQLGVKPWACFTSNPEQNPRLLCARHVEAGMEAVLRTRGQELGAGQGQRSGGWRLLSEVRELRWECSSGSEGRVR